MNIDANRLLDAWERGRAQTPAVRALLLLDAVPAADGHTAEQASIGERDARLIALREQWFGAQVECLGRCPHCGQSIELGFALTDIRLGHAQPDTQLEIVSAGRPLRLRLPNSADLLALAGETDAGQARRSLLARCLLGTDEPSAQAPEACVLDELAPDEIEQIERRMAELDPQAEVMLQLECPDCDTASSAPFEIENFLWSEVDAWARAQLVEVHRIAMAYGWSEREILAMGPGRRRIYLELIA